MKSRPFSKAVRSVMQFVGGIGFAIILITVTTLFVIAGTLIESITDSHRFAALLTYDSPFFALILWGFFLNILISALRRWPFRLKHIPFLITHFGLLMILSGVLVKNHYGIQGTMNLIEGSGGNEIFIPNSYALMVQQGNHKISYPIKSPFVHHSKIAPNVTLIDFIPHCYESLETWIKNDKLIISGFPTIPIQQDFDPTPISLSAKAAPWFTSALHCDSVEESAMKRYMATTALEIREKSSGNLILKSSLEDLLTHSERDNVQANLHFNWTAISGFKAPHLAIKYLQSDINHHITLALDGELALVNKHLSDFTQKEFLISLKRPSELIFLQDLHNDVFLFAFNSDGRVYSESFRQGGLKSLIAYNEGFNGYAVTTVIPFSKQLDRYEQLSETLSEASKDPKKLTPPLQMLLEASLLQDGLDFASLTIQFMDLWQSKGGWLISPHEKMEPFLEASMKALNWNKIPKEIYLGSFWTSAVFEKIDPLLARNKSHQEIIESIHWPIPTSESPWEEITQQIYSTTHLLPFQDKEESPITLARMFSAYCRAWGICPNRFFEIPISGTVDDSIPLECPLSHHQSYALSLSKLENNQPCLRLRFKEEMQQQQINLTYDRFGSKLKWPVLNGKYLVRFQQMNQSIPYRVRLREARQINYAGSQQPFSYECDLLITDSNGTTMDKTISMNHVHETWEGYRFYLASVYPATPGEIKRVQIVVNYDPAKYILTYPGAIILTLGILLLFLKRKRKNANH